jgi:ABC-2 type transport system ATP-binding protein
VTDASPTGATAPRSADPRGRPRRLAIEAHGLRKRYGKVEALCEVDLAVPEGSVLGLLGPNGAGKTTAVRILTTLIPPDAGSARVAGYDVVAEAAALRAHIGLAGQYAAVDENLTGFENLEMVGRLYHLGRARARRRAGELLERFGLSGAAGRLVRTYSGGMRRRLDLGAALVASPPVLFLDEPTTGLDPRSRIGLWEALEARVAEGTTVLLTTQYLDEADRLADRIAVIDRGTVIAEGTSDELKARVGGDQLEVVLEDAAQADSAVAALEPMAAEPPAVRDGTVVATPRERRGAIAEAVRRLDAAGVHIEDIALRRPTLDDVFLVLTGRAAEQDEEEGAQERATERTPS